NFLSFAFSGAPGMRELRRTLADRRAKPAIPCERIHSQFYYKTIFAIFQGVSDRSCRKICFFACLRAASAPFIAVATESRPDFRYTGVASKAPGARRPGPTRRNGNKVSDRYGGTFYEDLSLHPLRQHCRSAA